VVALAFACFYPKVGNILSIIGAFAGFFIVYFLPVVGYLKKMKTQIQYPMVAKALQKN